MRPLGLPALDEDTMVSLLLSFVLLSLDGDEMDGITCSLKYVLLPQLVLLPGLVWGFHFVASSTVVQPSYIGHLS